MPVSNWLRSMFGRTRTGTIRNAPRSTNRSRLSVEGLEDRAVPAKIALVYADYDAYAADVEAKLVSTGQFTANDIDLINVVSSTPTLATLNNYASVLTWSDFGYATQRLSGMYSPVT